MIDSTNNIPNPSEPPASWLPALTAILDEQDQSTSQLESLSKTQAGIIERSATDDLLTLLGQRQRLLDSALASARQLEPFVRQWEEFMAALPQRDRADCIARVRQIQDRIDRIGARDDQDRAELSKQRNDLTNELAGVGHSRGAIAAYASPTQRKPNPRFQDREV